MALRIILCITFKRDFYDTIFIYYILYKHFFYVHTVH